MSRTNIFKKSLSYSDLIDEHGDSVYRFCRSITFSREDAEDLFQETFLKALEQFEKIRQAESPLNFLLSTAAYIQKSRKRKYARRRRIAPTGPLNDEIVSEGNQEEDFLAREQARQVRDTVDSLSDKLKLPVVLYYQAQLPVKEIAETLNLPEGTIKSRLHKARKIIKKKLEE
ncbi:MAG: sigma-70 family RNA polymerase sigma factor [Clostridiales Family XIII bacterium]|jgi:RNA polymerase sigma-70 factor (ECF subfamily)|nr:sigma-70 family RNA polymerase sigma factor [Clostridiales Family XIII bacterium]